MHKAPPVRTHFRLKLLRLSAAATAISGTLALLVTLTAHADDKAESQTDKAKSERAARLEVMRGHARSLAVARGSVGKSVEAELVEVPLLHYNNPAGPPFFCQPFLFG